MAFLDPDKPIVTCVAEACDGCPVGDTLHCHFTARDLTYFLILVSPTFVAGGAGIYHVGWGFLIPWLIIAFGFFGLVEIRVMCSHCPHYAEKGMSLQCWANYGAPRLWRYRPGPMSSTEKAVFWAGGGLVVVYPLVFFLMGMQWLLLVLFVLTLVVVAMTMRRQMCSRCMNFACPLNVVGDEVRQQFFERNPRVAEAWGVEPGSS